MDEINYGELRLTWPYMDKICAHCIWANVSDEYKLCGYFNKAVEPQQPACNYFVNWYVRCLL